MDYLFYSLSLLLIYVGLAQLLHIQFGLLGIANFGVAGFWGIGLYVTGVLNVQLGVPLFPAILVASIGTAVLAALFGKLILPRGGQAMLCGSLALATAVSVLIVSEKSLTNGVQGLGTVSYPLSGLANSQLIFFLFLLVLTALFIWWTARLRASRLGRVLVAVRDNEELAESLGKNTEGIKLVVFALTSGGMGLLGGLSAPIHQFLVPYLVSASLTFTVWIALVLGGKAQTFGGLLGVLLTFGLFDILIETYMPLPTGYASLVPNIKLFCYGALLVLAIMFRPDGILSQTKPSVTTGKAGQ